MKKIRSSRLGAAALALAGAPLGLGLVGAPASAATDVDARTLGTGARPDLDYMVGRQIHPRGKPAFTADLPPVKTGTLTLLGYGTRGFVVQRQGYSASLYTVRRNGSVNRFKHFNMGGYPWYALLNPAGDTVATSFTDRGDMSGVGLVRTDGTQVGSRTFDGWYGAREANRNSIVLGGSETTTRWTPGQGVKRLSSSAADFADSRTDTLFLSDGTSISGPTRLSAPGAPRWKARFHAQAISPDGTRVAGYVPERPRHIQIRSMATGAVLASFRSATGVDPSTMAFEKSGALIWQARTPKGSTLVRCRATTQCRRATGFRATDFSVPRER